MNEIAVRADIAHVRNGEVQAPTSTTSPMQMLSRLVDTGGSPEIIEKFMALAERWEANQGRKSFDEAVSLAKAKIGPITKNRKGHNDKRYADFSALAKVVDPVLAEIGLSYRFRTDQDEKFIRVTCVLSHKDGHSDTTTLSGPADNSGGKNAIQAIGSTLTYLQRYSLIQMLGLAVSEDDDGKASGGAETIDDAQRKTIETLLTETESDFGMFCDFWDIDGVALLPASKFPQAKLLLEQRKKARNK